MAYVGTVTAPTNQANVVVQSPDPPGVYSRYAGKTSIVLGGIQIAAGACVLLASIIALATYGAIGVLGDLFCGVLFVAAGTFGIVAGQYKTNSPIVGCMVLSIFSSIVSVSAFFVWVVAAGAIRVIYAHNKYLNVIIAISCIFIVVFLVESIASIWAAAICCNVACCGRGHGVAVVSPLYQTQRGQVVVTVMHNQGQYPVQQVPNPPPYMQGGYPMQQPGQGNYPMAPTPYGAGIPMQNPCPPYNPGMAPNSSGSAPPNIAYAGDQVQPGGPPKY